MSRILKAVLLTGILVFGLTSTMLTLSGCDKSRADSAKKAGGHPGAAYDEYCRSLNRKKKEAISMRWLRGLSSNG